MKKSEMIHSLTHFLYENVGQFQPGHVGLALSVCIKLAPLLLEQIEQDGMLPPFVDKSPGDKDFDPCNRMDLVVGQAIYAGQCEWDPEDENL